MPPRRARRRAPPPTAPAPRRERRGMEICFRGSGKGERQSERELRKVFVGEESAACACRGDGEVQTQTVFFLLLFPTRETEERFRGVCTCKNWGKRLSGERTRPRESNQFFESTPRAASLLLRDVDFCSLSFLPARRRCHGTIPNQDERLEVSSATWVVSGTHIQAAKEENEREREKSTGQCPPCSFGSSAVEKTNKKQDCHVLLQQLGLSQQILKGAARAP